MSPKWPYTLSFPRSGVGTDGADALRPYLRLTTQSVEAGRSHGGPWERDEVNKIRIIVKEVEAFTDDYVGDLERYLDKEEG